MIFIKILFRESNWNLSGPDINKSFHLMDLHTKRHSPYAHAYTISVLAKIYATTPLPERL